MAHAQRQRTPETTLTQVFNAKQLSKETFAHSLLEQIPIEQLTAVLAEMRTKYGKADRTEKNGDAYQVITENYRIPATVTFDQQQRIVGLLFKPAIPRASDAGELLAKLKQLSGTTALFLAKNGKDVLSHNADKALAVGSAFKLAVLVALQEKLQQGQVKWSDVITLENKHISLPSGILQDMPPGAPITLHTLASLMIAHSDNTATDALMDFLGRQRIEEIAGIQPFLTTREMFQLKADRDLYQKYAQSSVADRRAILAGLADVKPPATGTFNTELRALDEWYIPLRKICGWLQQVRSLDVMQINPGLATKSDWKSVAYKGGSNVGVLNYSTWLEDESGTQFCLAATWNTDKPIDQSKLAGLYTGLMSLMHNTKLK